MENNKKYEISCVEADGCDYCCRVFNSLEEAEFHLKNDSGYKDEPLYEHYYVCPAGVAENIPSIFDQDT